MGLKTPMRCPPCPPSLVSTPSEGTAATIIIIIIIIINFACRKIPEMPMLPFWDAGRAQREGEREHLSTGRACAVMYGASERALPRPSARHLEGSGRSLALLPTCVEWTEEYGTRERENMGKGRFSAKLQFSLNAWSLYARDFIPTLLVCLHRLKKRA